MRLKRIADGLLCFKVKKAKKTKEKRKKRKKKKDKKIIRDTTEYNL